MNSIRYQTPIVKKNMFERLTKAVMLLLIPLGLYIFVSNFPAYKVFKFGSPGWVLWVSYANDLIYPFVFYFLMCLAERWLRTWQMRALIAWSIFVLLEFRQLFYYQFLSEPRGYGGAFDWMDIVMYTVSVGLAVLAERWILAKLFRNW